MIFSSKRLEAIVEWVSGKVLADIGCDHAYVAVSSVLSNKVSKAYACDIATGPLENAKKTIEAYNVQDRVIPFLTNGMENLSDEVDVVVIAGMGAKTIEMILDNGNLNGKRFLLMPHKDADELRVYCANHNLKICRERMIFEDNHYYPLMEVCFDISNNQSLSEAEILYGVNMLDDSTYSNYLEHELSKWSLIYNQMPEDKKSIYENRLEILKKLKA